MLARCGAVAAVLVTGLALAGCGGGGGGSTAPTSEDRPGGALLLAVASDPTTIDPLEASRRSALAVTRQLHEPLFARVTAPFGERRRTQGLALSAAASADHRLWRLSLRRGVRFQDGRPFNSEAVAANATRWMTRPEGRRLLPGLRTVDTPRGTVVRLVFARPLADLPRRLASPRLGIVSPAALEPASGTGARLTRTVHTGTGPFELREWRRGRQLTLARSDRWWGARYRLGPALDQIELRVVADPAGRFALLRQGEALVADDLDPVSAKAAGRNPLLTVISSPGGPAVGLERSVRGFPAGPGADSFSGVWLTRLGG